MTTCPDRAPLHAMSTIPFRDLPDAGLLRRLAAALYDGLLILALWFTFGLAVAIIRFLIRPPDMAGPIEPLLPPDIAPLVILPLLWLIAAGFYVWFWRHGGQTLGMKTWRLKLVTAHADQQTPTPGLLLLRAIVGTISLSVFLLGYLWLLIDRDHRTWHDRTSQTRVILLPAENS